MKITEYQGIISETAVYPVLVDGFGLAYGYIGLIDETEEYMVELNKMYYSTLEERDANRSALVKETGDVIWYVTLISSLLHLNIVDIIENDINTKHSLGSMAGMVKKHYRDSKQINKELVTNVLKSTMTMIKEDLDFVNASLDNKITIEEVLQTNYDKLKDRKNRNIIKGDGDNR